MLLHIVARGKIGRSPEAELTGRYLKRISWPTKVTELPDSSRNDFGYTVGGPIYIPGTFNADKKKLFFFWSQEYTGQYVLGGAALRLRL